MFRCPIDGTSSAAVAVRLEVRQLVGAVSARVVLVVGEPFIVRHRQQAVVLGPSEEHLRKPRVYAHISQLRPIICRNVKSRTICASGGHNQELMFEQKANLDIFYYY